MLLFDFNAVEIFTHNRYPARIADEKNFMRQFIRAQIEMINGTPAVDDETFSCGTGVTACAIICHHNDVGYNDVTVITKGGKLVVKYDRSYENGYTNIWLCGPAEKAFEGKTEVYMKKSIA